MMSAIHVLAYLLVPAISMCLAWGIRGQTGHAWGAALCGATVGLALAMVSRDPAKVKKAFALGAAGGFGYAWGGMMSYGRVAALATNPQATGTQIALSLAQLFLLGAIWGGLGGGVLGIACSRRNYGPVAPLLIFGACWLAGKVLYVVLIDALQFDIGHRHQSWAFMLGAWLALLIACWRDGTVLTMSILGGLGIGGGFVVGPLLTRVGLYPFVQALQLPLDWWKVAEHTIGFFGGLGLGLALLLLERRGHAAYLPERAHPVRPFLAQAFTLWFIPAWNASNVFTYWAVEKGLMSTKVCGLYLFAALGALLAAAGCWLGRLYGGAGMGPRLNETAAAALGLFWLVWTGTLIAGLKMLWPYQGAGYVLTQIGFTVMAVLVTAYLVIRAPNAKGA
jgi:hypothetical protein